VPGGGAILSANADLTLDQAVVSNWELLTTAVLPLRNRPPPRKDELFVTTAWSSVSVGVGAEDCSATRHRVRSRWQGHPEIFTTVLAGVLISKIREHCCRRSSGCGTGPMISSGLVIWKLGPTNSSSRSRPPEEMRSAVPSLRRP